MQGLERLDERAISRVNGAAWTTLRGAFFRVAKALLAVSPQTRSQLTTIYVKFCVDDQLDTVYAVVWLKTSRQIVVGLNVPEEHRPISVPRSMPGHAYKNLNAYFVIDPDDVIPDRLFDCIPVAYLHASSSVIK